jgi:sec-independent protein translocase protein TatC
VVAMAVLAAAVTPTVDPVNMGLVMAPLMGLYLISILLAAFVGRG